MVSQIESPSLIVASFSILLLLLSSLATTMASTTEAATASTSSHTQKKEHGKETFFFSLPLKLLVAGCRVFCRRHRAAKRRASWLAWPLGLSLGLVPVVVVASPPLLITWAVVFWPRTRQKFRELMLPIGIIFLLSPLTLYSAPSRFSKHVIVRM